MRKAKIVATIGPASRSPEQLYSLMMAGLDVIRVNMSHGSHDYHAEAIATARQLARELKRPLAILLDLSGPKIRTGKLFNHQPIFLRAQQTITITTQDLPGDETVISTSYTHLPQDVTTGDRILLSDGLIELRVEQVGMTDVLCRIINSGELGENKGINLPGVKLSAPSLTEKDRGDLKFGLEQQVDYVALIAKIEKREALDDLDRIIEASDGVMVARGDLGVETAVESVPFYQKQIIAKANAAEKLVITATQMLESMKHEPRPTRAEASDVANAILDGTDAVMLSAETAVGEYATESVETMARIISFTESNCPRKGRVRDLLDGRQNGLEGRAIAEAATYAAEEIRSRVIVVFSKSGNMARHLAALRPSQRIIAFTPHDRTVSALAAVWGIEPFQLDLTGRTYELLARADEVLLSQAVVQRGETIVAMAGHLPEQPSLSSMMKLHRVGEISLH